MNKKRLTILSGSIVITAVIIHMMRKNVEKNIYRAEIMPPLPDRKIGYYERYGKRIIDIICSIGAIVFFSPIYLGIAVLVKFKLGSPVLFVQERPGQTKDGKETIFKMYKFRTMTDERDENGELLPDEKRLTSFGKWLRSTSLDELPEVINILNGSMSIIGPRPQLVVDLCSMSDKQRMRHTAKPGLSGLAQVNGRNRICWEERLNWDLKYIEKVSLKGDLSILLKTVKTAFIEHDGITQKDMATSMDYVDNLLQTGRINETKYREIKQRAKSILNHEYN